MPTPRVTSVSGTTPTTVLDHQGLPWLVREAYVTAHNFEVYKGYPATNEHAPRRLAYVRTQALVDYIRAHRAKDMQLPISRKVLYEIRKSLGLAVARTPMNYSFKWTAQHIALLGTMSDRALGKKLGVGYAVVRGKRYALNVPAYDFEYWTPEKIALLGTRPDRELSQMLGISFAAVAKKRDTLHIPAFGNWVRKGAKPARYQDPETGATWNGFGIAPLWIKAKERWRFVVG
jgi:hypothetical protein